MTTREAVLTPAPALVELRRYRLKRGCHERLATLFAREFVGPMRIDGIQVLGWFADADEPDHFVWLRGYPQADPQARADALGRFYFGPASKDHREAANDTMLDSDDVLLLRPAREGCGLPAAGSGRSGESLRVTTCPLTRAEPAAAGLEPAIARLCADAGRGVAALVSAEVPNLFPGLPVRDEQALVWLEPAGDADGAARLEDVTGLLGARLSGAPHVALLRPSAGSPNPLA